MLFFPSIIYAQYITTEKEPIKIDDELLYPSDLVVINDILFVKDLLESTGEYGIKAFNIKDGRKVNEFISIGRGPSEYLSINIRRGPGEKSIEITDSRNRKNDIYSIECLVGKNIDTNDISDCLETSIDNMTSREAIIISDSIVINTASGTDGVIFLSKRGQILEYIDEIPGEIIGKYEKPAVATAAMGGYLVTNKNRSSFAYFAKYYDHSFFMNEKEGNFYVVRDNKFTHLPEFSVMNVGGSSYMEPSEKAKFGYISPVSTEKYIYVLYSGRTLDDVEESELVEWRAFSNRVKVFDWRGEEVAEILFAEQLSNIAVSSDGKTLYGVTTDKDLNSKIVKYSLNYN